MKTIEELKKEHAKLLDGLTKENYPKIKKRLAEISAEISDVNVANLLNGFNRRQERLRELAALAWDAEQPAEDVTTNDGSFHKAKVKKYPKLAALQYGHAKWEDGRITELRINGEKFSMYRRFYEYNKPVEYTRPASFDEFLELNTISPADITIEQYKALSNELNRLKSELQGHIKQYKAGLESINASRFNYWGLIGQDNEHLYTYSPKS